MLYVEPFHIGIVHMKTRCYVPSAKHISLITYSRASHCTAIPHCRLLSEAPKQQNELTLGTSSLPRHESDDAAKGGGVVEGE